MKKIAYLLLVAGFLLGAYATSLNEQNVEWTLFVIAAIAAVAGVVIAKRSDRADARADHVLEANRGELNESIGNIVRDLEEMTSGDMPKDEQLREWIDHRLRPDLRRFVEARESMVHLYSLQTYADIMSEFAAGERYINRVWSASADGYAEEAARYLHRAVGQFADARDQLARAGAGLTTG
ncbi:MAG: hypothetical protein KJN77_00640 [Gammaproteobacteria bacterium]|nr:hypothetical protein [Gammaproteobacteria bacterium]